MQEVSNDGPKNLNWISKQMRIREKKNSENMACQWIGDPSKIEELLELG